MAMRFEVPQFIDVKDKIFGPFTFSQFLYMVGGGGLAYIAVKAIPTFLKYPIALALLLLGLALAFYKINGRPFSVVLQAFFTYILSAKLYLWRQRKQQSPEELAQKLATVKKQEIKEQKIAVVPEAPITRSRLKDLAWNLDIMDSRTNLRNYEEKKEKAV